VLHSWANSTLGRIENWARRIGGGIPPADFLRRCAAYIEWHERNPSFLLHHTHKSSEQKATARKKKAAATRKAKREAATSAD
jgi:hypothetical protein